MRLIAIILCIITFALFTGGCNRISANYADEIVSSDWFVNNPSGISAELDFTPDSGVVTMNISDSVKRVISIKGTYAIDPKNLYIVSEQIASVYMFEYEVYNDRLILTYNSEELTFYVKKSEP